jgi:hypothetical protein
MVLMLADGKLHLLSFDLELKHTISGNLNSLILFKNNLTNIIPRKCDPICSERRRKGK